MSRSAQLCGKRGLSRPFGHRPGGTTAACTLARGSRTRPSAAAPSSANLSHTGRPHVPWAWPLAHGAVSTAPAPPRLPHCAGCRDLCICHCSVGNPSVPARRPQVKRGPQGICVCEALLAEALETVTEQPSQRPALGPPCCP